MTRVFSSLNPVRLGIVAGVATALLLASPLSGPADDTHPAVPTDDTHPPIPTGGPSAGPDVDIVPDVPLPPPNPPPPVEQENGKPIWGIYVGNKVDDIYKFDQWFGRPSDAILSYTGDRSWADCEGSIGWAMHLWTPAQRRVVWSVSFIPKGCTLADAAKGKYNDHWKTVADKLAKWHPEEKIIYIRTAWEFNGAWFHFNAVHKEKAFIGAWRQFVTVFRAASPRFRFDWCPAGASWTPMKAENAYPGDGYVDIIGLDIYDQTKWCKIQDPVQRWDKVYLHGDHGLLWHQQFAAEHHKPMSYPEWGDGGVGSGDNPYFIEQMHKWMVDNHVIYASYWDSNSNYHGKLSDNQYPQAAEKFKELFGPESEANPAPAPAPPPAAPATNAAPVTAAPPAAQ